MFFSQANSLFSFVLLQLSISFFHNSSFGTRLSYIHFARTPWKTKPGTMSLPSNRSHIVTCVCFCGNLLATHFLAMGMAWTTQKTTVAIPFLLLHAHYFEHCLEMGLHFTVHLASINIKEEHKGKLNMLLAILFAIYSITVNFIEA